MLALSISLSLLQIISANARQLLVTHRLQHQFPVRHETVRLQQGCMNHDGSEVILLTTTGVQKWAKSKDQSQYTMKHHDASPIKAISCKFQPGQNTYVLLRAGKNRASVDVEFEGDDKNEMKRDVIFKDGVDRTRAITFSKDGTIATVCCNNCSFFQRDNGGKWSFLPNATSNIKLDCETDNNHPQRAAIAGSKILISSSCGVHLFNFTSNQFIHTQKISLLQSFSPIPVILSQDLSTLGYALNNSIFLSRSSHSGYSPLQTIFVPSPPSALYFSSDTHKLFVQLIGQLHIYTRLYSMAEFMLAKEIRWGEGCEAEVGLRFILVVCATGAVEIYELEEELSEMAKDTKMVLVAVALVCLVGFTVGFWLIKRYWRIYGTQIKAISNPMAVEIPPASKQKRDQSTEIVLAEAE